MFDRDDVELALLALEEGMSPGEAAELVGASRSAVRRWASGRVPHARPRGRMAGTAGRREGGPVNDDERAAYEAAMTENMLLRAVLDDLKGAGSHPGSMSNRRKCELGERLRAATGLPLREITAFLRISKSSYEYHRARLGRDRHSGLRAEVVRLFRAMGGSRGYRPVHAALRREGVRASEKVVRRIMREEGLRARRPGRRPYSSYAGEPSPAPPNLPRERAAARRAADPSYALDHDFSAARPNELRVTDITEFSLPGGAGRAYLSPVVDCFDGRPVAWSVGPRPTAELANSSLEAACSALSEGERPVVHSDRGGHYRWPGWVAICESHGLARSMSRKGRSCDNARMEGFFGTLKSEFFHPRDWRGWTLEGFMAELDGWMRRFNAERISQRLGWLTPDEYRRSLGLAV